MKDKTGERRPAVSGFGRREMMAFFGAAAVTLVGAPRRTFAVEAGTNPLPASKVPSCVLKPQQTEGPYFIDEKLNRSDIRDDPVDGTLKAGVELRLAFNVSQVDGGRCAPLAGAIVDIWQCDALGVYSDVSDNSFDTRGKKFLRGHQVTDKTGAARFITIYPGWYPGRTVHIHFKIRTDAASRREREFTSQLYFEDALSDEIFALAPYAARGKRDRKNDRDGIYRRGGSELLLHPTKDDKAYAATFDLGLALG
jgi:protocatechuate 3,4-dioxygenase beta subunit